MTRYTTLIFATLLMGCSTAAASYSEDWDPQSESKSSQAWCKDGEWGCQCRQVYPFCNPTTVISGEPLNCMMGDDYQICGLTIDPCESRVRIIAPDAGNGDCAASCGVLSDCALEQLEPVENLPI